MIYYCIVNFVVFKIFVEPRAFTMPGRGQGLILSRAGFIRYIYNSGVCLRNKPLDTDLVKGSRAPDATQPAPVNKDSWVTVRDPVTNGVYYWNKETSKTGF